MGVFARFRRKAKDSEETTTEAAAAASVTAEPEKTEGTAEGSPGSTDSKPVAEAGTDKESAAEDKPAEGGGEAAAAEGVDIPKQQSAEKAADTEAGEGARK
jgi:hypothetical protein